MQNIRILRFHVIFGINWRVAATLGRLRRYKGISRNISWCRRERISTSWLAGSEGDVYYWYSGSKATRTLRRCPCVLRDELCNLKNVIFYDFLWRFKIDVKRIHMLVCLFLLGNGHCATYSLPAEPAFLSCDEHNNTNNTNDTDRSGFWWWVVLWRWRVLDGGRWAVGGGNTLYAVTDVGIPILRSNAYWDFHCTHSHCTQ